MKTNSEYIEVNSTTRCSTNIFNSFKLNRLYVVTFPYLIKNKNFIARRFSALNVTSLIGIIESSVRIQTKKYTTNVSILNNALDNKKIDKNLIHLYESI